ncbi:type II toxin-antitoxin system RelE/ParE family toxin [Marinihelvus fidelis]|uniref:Type II toxin-antitoxin system RelE/ParE family toxin n=1 Tax=Marinihelvus fidelis TaxID=2613842 RepID=A0A5N0T7G0_9GAMM|nr:type II toxin-antitoxin system RelE/ParE family toxin [Marinihelvus fidelis]KAA9129756.1 type II toxin-antitoxin system RelE/ParE family toxin [Marinihelvus fidelis]
MRRVLKRRSFAKWQAGENIRNAVLCNVVLEMERGLIDAVLGESLYKMRVSRPGGGKRSGYRVFVAARLGTRYVFMHGFPKNVRANITRSEKKALQFAGKAFLELTGNALVESLKAGVLLEVDCE